MLACKVLYLPSTMLLYPLLAGACFFLVSSPFFVWPSSLTLSDDSALGVSHSFLFHSSFAFPP